MTAATAGGAWVADNSWSSWNDLIVNQAELVIGLDYPRLLSLGRLLRRTIARSITHEPVCNGNFETIGRAFARRDSIIAWHFQTWKQKRRQMRAWATDQGAPPTLLFQRPRDLDAWIAGLDPAGARRRDGGVAG